MDFTWPASFQASSRLMIFNESVAGWSVALERGVRDFNRLMEASQLKLRYEITTHRSAANVFVRTAGPDKVANPLHGETDYPQKVIGDATPFSTICLRDRPQVLGWIRDPVKKDRQQVWRTPGDAALSVVVAHELLHACGLEAHCDGDVFAEELVAECGYRSADDRLRNKASGMPFPPLFLTPDTKARLRTIWP